VRSACEGDCDAVCRLLELNRSDGMVEAADPAEDLKNLTTVYLTPQGRSRFWVVEEGELGVVGMVGVRAEEETMAWVRRLHVHPQRRQLGIGSALVREALGYCHDQGFVKVVLETKEDQTAAIALFTRFGFRLNRVKQIEAGKKLEFYVDLYFKPEADRG
jgi:ribosomal protein S18 acetylase RimI-like enzyme